MEILLRGRRVNLEQYWEEKKLIEEMKYRLFNNVLIGLSKSSSFPRKKEFDHSSRSFQLKNFFSETGEAEAWLRARVLESVATSVGLDEYISALIYFRDSSPDKMAPINSLFASSHIARALDFFILELLKRLENKKKLIIDEERIKAIKSILGEKNSLKVEFHDEIFGIEEIEHTRRLILNEAFNLLEAKHLTIKQEIKLDHFLRIPEDLTPVEEAPDLNLKRLTKLSQHYRNLLILIIDGILVWQFGKEPKLFIKDRAFHYSPRRSLEYKKTSLAEAKRQVRIVKRIIRGTSNAG